MNDRDPRQGRHVDVAVRAVECRPDRPQHLVEVIHHVAIRELEHADALALESVAAVQVVLDLVRVLSVVRTSVQEDRDVGISVLGVDPGDDPSPDVPVDLKGGQRQPCRLESLEELLLEERFEGSRSTWIW